MRTGISSATRYLCKIKKFAHLTKLKIKVINREGVEIFTVDNREAYYTKRDKLMRYGNYD